MGEQLMTDICPHCQQPISDLVGGVRLPRFKAKMFHHIDTHPGVSVNDLAAWMYEDLSKIKHPLGSIRSHVSQTNEVLAHTGLRIHGRQYQGYNIVRRNENGQGVDRQVG